MFVMLKIEHSFTLWANGHLTMDIIKSAQQSGIRFKFIGQQKDWAFTFDKWGHGVNDYVASMLEMESKNRLGLCDEAREMVKASKGCSRLRLKPNQQRLLDGVLFSKKVSLPLLLEVSVLQLVNL